MRRIPKLARQFLATESAGGIVMIFAALLAIIAANSALAPNYHAFLAAPLPMHMDVSLFTKDVLMAIFFFAVGMELKSEMREGALAAKGQKLLPAMAAIGGIVAPALLYLAVTQGAPELRAGWAIPTATDIAFALCVLRLIGPSVPNSAKIFLLAIAIYDDLAAILIIAFFYSSGVALMPLAASVAIGAGLFLLNRLHVSRLLPYLLFGAAMWVALHEAGIHPTIAGVVTGIAIPMRTRSNAPLLNHLLHRLHPFVGFCILPLFAFVSAGVDLRGISPSDALAPFPVGIALALFFGKQIGIFGAAYACVKSGLAPLPNGVNWRLVYGVSMMAGIGFTMSLFIGQLAFSDPQMQDEVKLGVIAGSLLSAAFGAIFLKMRRSS